MSMVSYAADLAPHYPITPGNLLPLGERLSAVPQVPFKVIKISF
jgi:hypothetical protein